jgi:hypothetical protein
MLFSNKTRNDRQAAATLNSLPAACLRMRCLLALKTREVLRNQRLRVFPQRTHSGFALQQL